MTGAAVLSGVGASLGRVRLLSLSNLRAAWWAMRSVRTLRVQLRENGLHTRLSPPPSLPSSAARGVTATARYLRATCLERSLLLQEWLLAHGERHTLIVGVRPPGDGPFVAHAWLEGHDRADDAGDYTHLVRVDPR